MEVTHIHTIPLHWFLLELELRKLGLIISKSRCWEIAQRLQFESEEALEVALRYLHEANLFLYYPDILDSVVFVNSKAVLDVITQLFELHIDLRDRDECDIVSDDDFRFRKQAIFRACTLSDCSTKAEYDKKVLPDEDLAKLLQHRLIIADISTEVPEHKYFMPSLLPIHENLQEYRPCETAADPLHIILAMIPSSGESSLPNQQIKSTRTAFSSQSVIPLGMTVSSSQQSM